MLNKIVDKIMSSSNLYCYCLDYGVRTTKRVIAITRSATALRAHVSIHHVKRS